MSKYTLENAELRKLQGKVVLITGAATGIGRSLAELVHSHGAKVAFCDVNEAQGRDLEVQLNDRAIFRKCDVSNWDEVASFFQDVYNTFGPIDAVISNAGIHVSEPFSADTSLEPPNISVFNVNLIGTWYVTKCAVHFFNKHPETPSQLVLIGSVASYFDTPPLYTYCASKAGVLGLMRTLKTQLPKLNVTVNMIAPWMTITPFLPEEVKKIWAELPANTPLEVATGGLLPVVRPELNGKSFVIHGENIIEVEDKLSELQHLWLGPELDRDMREGQRRLAPPNP
ncbi:hypothetical protein ACJZ2D_016209 [Fusarium nematophilum]